MKGKLLLISTLCFFYLQANSQEKPIVKASDSIATLSKTSDLFGDTGKYNTFNIGVNAGITSGLIPFLNNSTNHFRASIGYGVTVRQQLSHAFSLQLDYYGGKIKGDDVAGQGNSGSTATKFGASYFQTKFNQVSVSGVVNLGSISFLHRENAVHFFGSAGLGVDFYKPAYAVTPGATAPEEGFIQTKNIKELAAPVGAGVKFKLTDALALNLGYTVAFVKGYNFSGFNTYDKFNHYTYTYGGLEYTFGSKSKKNLQWVNPVAIGYDNLYDTELRQEIEVLKGRVSNVEAAANDLKKDSDGDGVSDQFDKCPNTPAGSIVDGSGCPIVFPKTVLDSSRVAPSSAYTNIQFVKNSAVLQTESYPVLDATSQDLRSNNHLVITVAGYTSPEEALITRRRTSMTHSQLNKKLSEIRAQNVKTYLVNSGVDDKQIKTEGNGPTKPLASNSTNDGRVINRRVEFHK